MSILQFLSRFSRKNQKSDKIYACSNYMILKRLKVNISDYMFDTRDYPNSNTGQS